MDSAPASGPVLHVSTRLVDVAAVVLDKRGNPVTDLKKEDFEVFEDGKRQRIRLFAPPAADAPVSTADTPGPVKPPRAPGVFSNMAGET